mgnify:CR=1 FL=1
MLNENITDHNKRLEFYKQGFSDSEIARRLHYSRTAITSWRMRNNLPINRASESEVVDILRNSPELTIVKICEMTNRSVSYVSMIAKKYSLSTNGQIRWRKVNNKERNS